MSKPEVIKNTCIISGAITKGYYDAQTVSLGRCKIGSLDNVAEAAGNRGRRVFQLIIVDANLLVYAHVSTLPQHERAREWNAVEKVIDAGHSASRAI